MHARRSGEQGFVLIGVIVACFLLLLALSIAAPTVAHELRREKEVEAVHRGNQYVRAIQLYYRKFGHYPTSVDQLEKSNNIRFLRQKYINPLTGKDDWRLIHVGEAKTTVKGFFGQPLAGLPGSAGGTATPIGNSGTAGTDTTSGTTTGGTTSSTASTGTTGTGTSSPGTGSSGATSAFGSGGNSSIGGSSSFDGSSSFGSPTATSGSNSGFGSSSNASSGTSGGGGLMMGVGISKPGDSIVDPNQQTTYATWEFIYDPRIEQLKAKAGLLGGGLPPVGSGSTGSTSTTTSGSGLGTTPGSTTPTPAPGSTTPGSSGPGGTTPQQ